MFQVFFTLCALLVRRCIELTTSIGFNQRIGRGFSGALFFCPVVKIAQTAGLRHASLNRCDPEKPFNPGSPGYEGAPLPRGAPSFPKSQISPFYCWNFRGLIG
jgi:hypothetical protein